MPPVPLLTPQFVTAQVLTLVSAVFVLLTAFGHGLSVDQQVAIFGVGSSVTTLAQVGWMLAHGRQQQAAAITGAAAAQYGATQVPGAPPPGMRV